jgi:FkbM family methyltransferase
MSFLLDFLRGGDCFVDVGANVGTYSLLAAATPEVRIVAFEPSSIAFRRLQENVALNKCSPWVEVHREAVGASPAWVSITVGRDTVNHVVASGDADASEGVVMVSLDEVLAGPEAERVRLIKIDVEGFEEQVLLGAQAVLAIASPVLIVEANDPAAIRDVLAPLGYHPFRYDPIGRRLESLGWLDVRDNNVLAVRDRSLVESRLGNAVKASTPCPHG